MVGQDYTITDMIKHGGGRNNALKNVGNSLHGRDYAEQTPSLSD
jgi:hypothetical protein